MFVDAEESLYLGIWVVKSSSKSKSLFFARHVIFRISEIWKSAIAKPPPCRGLVSLRWTDEGVYAGCPCGSVKFS